MGAMSMDIWKYDLSTNKITDVIKSADTVFNKSVRMLTFGTFRKE